MRNDITRRRGKGPEEPQLVVRTGRIGRVAGCLLSLVAMSPVAAVAETAPTVRYPQLKEMSRRVLRTNDKSPMNFCFANSFPDGSVYLSHSIGMHTKDEHHVRMSSTDFGRTWKMDGPVGGMNSFWTLDGKKRFVDCWSKVCTNVHTISVTTIDAQGNRSVGRSTVSWPFMRKMLLHRSVLRLPNRDLLVTGYATGPKKCLSYAFVLVSGDDGLTWRYLSDFPYPTDPMEGLNEAGITLLKDGRLYACVRTGNAMVKYQYPCEIALAAYTSEDNGKSWRFQRYVADYGVDPQLLTLSDGTVALLSGRPGVYLMLDPTGTGDHFKRYDIYTGQGSSYSSLMEVKPGKLLLIYDESDFLHLKGPKVSRIIAVDFDYR